MIQAPTSSGAQIMRYELADHVDRHCRTSAVEDPRANDRRVLNGIFWLLRSGAHWRDRPEALGPYTTCYNRFVRWRRATRYDRLAANCLASAQLASVRLQLCHHESASYGRRTDLTLAQDCFGITPASQWHDRQITSDFQKSCQALASEIFRFRCCANQRHNFARLAAR